MFRSVAFLVTFVTVTSAFDLTLLHTNDLHSRFDEITSRGSACRPKDKSAGKCFGGVARLKAAVDAVKRQNPGTTVFLNAGDFFQVNFLRSQIIKIRLQKSDSELGS